MLGPECARSDWRWVSSSKISTGLSEVVLSREEEETPREGDNWDTDIE